MLVMVGTHYICVRDIYILSKKIRLVNTKTTYFKLPTFLLLFSRWPRLNDVSIRVIKSVLGTSSLSAVTSLYH